MFILQILGYMMKTFAKVCLIGDASKGSLSSYAYTLMVIYYLQRCDPPIVPVLQEVCMIILLSVFNPDFWLFYRARVPTLLKSMAFIKCRVSKKLECPQYILNGLKYWYHTSTKLIIIYFFGLWDHIFMVEGAILYF